MSHDKILESDVESLLEKITTHVEGNDDEESTVLFKFEGDRLVHLWTFFVPKLWKYVLVIQYYPQYPGLI